MTFTYKAPVFTGSIFYIPIWGGDPSIELGAEFHEFLAKKHAHITKLSKTPMSHFDSIRKELDEYGRLSRWLADTQDYLYKMQDHYEELFARLPSGKILDANK